MRWQLLPSHRHSNGKSSIVQERLYSFFFALFQNKSNFSFFSFFLFFTITNEDVRFDSILYCTILEGFAFFCFNTPMRFTFDFESAGLIPFASLHYSKIL
jgi:hypothetical protein